MSLESEIDELSAEGASRAGKRVEDGNKKVVQQLAVPIVLLQLLLLLLLLWLWPLLLLLWLRPSALRFLLATQCVNLGIDAP